MDVALSVLVGIVFYGIVLLYASGLVWAAWGAIKDRPAPNPPKGIKEDSAGIDSGSE